MIILLIISLFVAINLAKQRINRENDKDIRKDFTQRFENYYEPLFWYIIQPSTLFGIVTALLIYTWMLAGLFQKYFHMFKFGHLFHIILNPTTIESIPHSLIILTVFYAFLKDAEHLRIIMMIPFLLISIPYIYRMMEDGFIAAQKEGVIENYLILPIRDRRVVKLFLKQKIHQVVTVPIIFFIILLVYWEFLYSGIGIIIGRKSAPAMFLTNFNDAFLKNEPELYKMLILLQIAFFAAIIILLLLLVHIFKAPEKIKRIRRTKDKPTVKPIPSDIMVSCSNVSISVPEYTRKNREFSRKIIVDALDFNIQKGENCCIMGESGCGKTTLVNAVSETLGKEFNVNGTITRYGYSIFPVFQDVDLYLSPYQSLYFYIKMAFKQRNRNGKDPANTGKIDNTFLVRRIYDLGLLKPLLDDSKHKAHGYTLHSIREALEKNNPSDIDPIASLLISRMKTKTKQKLSGGEKQKFYLLLAFIVSPDILIADEIFTDIDRASTTRIAQLLFNGESTVIFISHDIGMIIELMKTGQLQKVYHFKNRQLDKNVWMAPPAGIADYALPPWAKDMSDAFERLKAEKIDRPDTADGNSIKSPEPLPLIELETVTKTFDDGRKVDFHIENGSLILRKGINYALKGENGSGKTTLFKILTKIHKFEGSIKLPGNGSQQLKNEPRLDWVRQNQLVFQKTGNAIIEDLHIEPYLLSFFEKKHRDAQRLKLDDMLTAFFGKDKAHQIKLKSFKSMSVGEQRRILLIRSLLLVEDDGILFIDEAMRGMDITLKEILVKYLKSKRMQIFLISHDPHLSHALCREKIQLEYDRASGKTFVSGPMELNENTGSNSGIEANTVTVEPRPVKDIYPSEEVLL
jgi:ABC-type dipeptide/oligopeptide/nickel transport system ATPase subunit